MEPRHWREVGGLVLPQSVAGHPALELVNTLSGWSGDHASDYLATYDHLLALTTDLGLVPTGDAPSLSARAADDPRGAGRVLADARHLRVTVRAAALAPTEPEALAAVSARARRARVAALLPGDRPRWGVPGAGDALPAPVDALAWAAVDLLTTADLTRVRTCPGRDCGWLFLDASGRRRWCDMRWCGNRAKVRAHAERQRVTRP